jgi:long-subunit fatty acid transport protein
MRQNSLRHGPLRHALLLALFGASSSALAITNLEPNAGLQFNFSNPGARSLGLGGAFTGLADDATAAYANPAGLTILRTQELAFEGRYTSFDTPFVTGGSANFTPFDDSGVLSDESSESILKPSFASWIYPSERFTFALFYHRLANFEADYTTDPIDIRINGNVTDVILGYNTELSFNVQNYGAAFGYQFNDSFSMGLSVAYSEFEIDSLTGRIDEPQFANQQTQRGSDDDFIYTLGALWRVNPQLNLGLAYRRGGSFEYAAINETLPTNTFHPNSITFQTSFDVPHILSAGLAYRPSDAWLFTLDVNRVYYSELSNEVIDIFGGIESPLQVDDGTEVRLGMEYAFINMERPLFLRAGVWRDPDHRLSVPSSELQDCAGADFFNCIDGVLFQSGDDETHYSLGLGWAFPKFQVDFAADFSELVDTYSVSGVYRF